MQITFDEDGFNQYMAILADAKKTGATVEIVGLCSGPCARCGDDTDRMLEYPDERQAEWVCHECK